MRAGAVKVDSGLLSLLKLQSGDGKVELGLGEGKLVADVDAEKLDPGLPGGIGDGLIDVPGTACIGGAIAPCGGA